MADNRFEIVVVGTGAVGLAAGLSFARAGFSTALVGSRVDRDDGRTAALLAGSLDFLSGLGIATALTEVSAPLRRLRIIDDTGSLFRPPPVEFRATEIGLDAFGRNVGNAALVGILSDAALRQPNLTWVEDLATGLIGEAQDTVRLADGRIFSGQLVVAADGRGSGLRRDAGITASDTRYEQAAFTTTFSHELGHGDASTEFHTRTGPATLVPLPGRRSSLVWVTRPDEAERLQALDNEGLARAIERRSHRLLGRVSPDGPRGRVPLSLLRVDRLGRGRLVLVGEAAHALPPIGAQGLNMGLADVEVLVGLARATLPDHSRLVAAYERRRGPDVRMRSMAVDGLNRSLLSGLLPVHAARGLGLGLLARIGPLRRAAMRAGSGSALRQRLSAAD